MDQKQIKVHILLLATTLFLGTSCSNSSSPEGSNGNTRPSHETDAERPAEAKPAGCQSGNCIDASDEPISVSAVQKDAALNESAAYDAKMKATTGGSSALADSDAVLIDTGNVLIDSGFEAVDSNNSEPVEICDGSDEIRLSLSGGGGFVDHSYDFLYPYGRVAIFVDGRCRYWAFDDPYVGIGSGTLSEQEARDLAADLKLSQLSQIAGFYQNPGCADGGTSYVAFGTEEISCYCNCPDAPEAIGQSIRKSRIWQQNLTERAEPLGGPIRLVFIAEFSCPTGGKVYDWPLVWDLAILSGWLSQTDYIPAEWEKRSTVIDDPYEIRLFRELADRVGNDQQGFAYSFYVKDTDAHSDSSPCYEVMLRDEIPADLKSAIDVFAGSIIRTR